MRFKYTTFVLAFAFFLSFAGLFVLEGPFVSGFNAGIAYFIPPDLLIDDSWYGIYFQGKYAGYSHSSLKAEEVAAGGGYALENETVMELPILGAFQKIDVDCRMFLTRSYLLRQARFEMFTPQYSFKGRLQRRDDKSFQLDVEGPNGKFSKNVKLSDQIVGSAVMPPFFAYLPDRKSVDYSFFDPVSERTFKMRIEKIGEKSVLIAGKHQPATLFKVRMGEVEGNIYVDKLGHMIKQELLGFELIKEDAEQLFKKNAQEREHDQNKQPM